MRTPLLLLGLCFLLSLLYIDLLLGLRRRNADGTVPLLPACPTSHCGYTHCSGAPPHNTELDAADDAVEGQRLKQQEA